MKGWEDGERFERQLDTTDRWVLHASDECCVTFDCSGKDLEVTIRQQVTQGRVLVGWGKSCVQLCPWGRGYLAGWVRRRRDGVRDCVKRLAGKTDRGVRGSRCLKFARWDSGGGCLGLPRGPGSAAAGGVAGMGALVGNSCNGKPSAQHQSKAVGRMLHTSCMARQLLPVLDSPWASASGGRPWVATAWAHGC